MNWGREGYYPASSLTGGTWMSQNSQIQWYLGARHYLVLGGATKVLKATKYQTSHFGRKGGETQGNRHPQVWACKVNLEQNFHIKIRWVPNSRSFKAVEYCPHLPHCVQPISPAPSRVASPSEEDAAWAPVHFPLLGPWSQPLQPPRP